LPLPEGARKKVVFENFTPWSALAGGSIIGLAASLLLLVNGRIAGISGILGGLLIPQRGEVAWRALFFAGLAGAGLATAVVAPASIGDATRSLPALAVAGVLVGAGTRFGNGCTSGHGVCGLSRFSKRSFFATLTFMAAGVVTASLTRILGGS
jgi:uncharacterized membrane protein YedE/YeeE